MNKLLLVLLVWLSSCAYTIPQYTSVTPAVYYASETTNVYKSPHGLPQGIYPAGTALTVIGEYNHWLIVRTAAYNCWVRRVNLMPGSPYAPAPEGVIHDTYTGPRGGRYYINGNGNKTYVTPQSTIDSHPIQTGPRGGQYYINSHGNKSYIKH